MTSWIFGSRQPQGPQEFSQFLQPPAASGGGDNGKDEEKTGHKMAPYRFDSEALERAAKAAKELEKSKFSEQILELSRAQEQTKQTEEQTKQKEMEVHVEQLKIEARSREGEERRNLLHEQAKLDQQKAQYQDQLARKRYDEQLAQQQRFNDDNLRKQEASAAKQEALRRATLEHELEQRSKMDANRIEAEILAKGQMERENKDVMLEKIRVQGAEDRETALKSLIETRETTIKALIEKRETILSTLKSASSSIGYGLNAFISDPNKVMTAAMGFAAVTAGYYGSKGSLRVLFNYLEARLMTPSLVRETSRIGVLDTLKHPIKTFKKIQKKPKDVLAGVILDPKIEARVRDIAIATKNTKYNKGTYRNIFIYGPPGTGKTLFAKKLALESGMDYAILTGGDVAMLKTNSVGAIHKLFDWAETSRKGLILFIDEAEGFLTKRHENISEDLRMAISAFLYRTGTQTDKFITVFSSNTPENLDFAVLSRIHEPIEFPLPTEAERVRLVGLYFGEYILKPASTGKRRLKIDDFDFSKLCSEIAKMTNGLSGREIANLALDWQMTTYTSADGIFTEDLMRSRAEAAVAFRETKNSWCSDIELQKMGISRAVVQEARK